MGCLFAKAPANRYQLKDYDRFQCLSLVNNPSDFFLLFRINGIWNSHLYQFSNGNVLQLLRNFTHISLDQMNQTPQILCEMFELSQQNLQIAFGNLPFQLFYNILLNDEEFLQKEMIIKDDLYDQQYSAFDDSESSQRIIGSNCEGEQNQEKSLDLSGIDPEPEMNQGVDEMKGIFEKKLNHSTLIKQFVNYICPNKSITKEQFYILLIKYKIIQYFRDQLLLDMWFGKINCEQFVWQKTTNENLVQRRLSVYDRRILIIATNDNSQLVEIIPLGFCVLQEITGNLNNKFCMELQVKILGIETQLYFDTKEEYETVFNNLSLNIFRKEYVYQQLDKENKIPQKMIECVNKKLGQKMSIEIYELNQLSVQNLNIHESLKEFKGITSIHEQILSLDRIYIVTNKIPFTLEQYHHKFNPLNEHQIRTITQQLISILNYIHLRGILLGLLLPNQIAVFPTKDEDDQINFIQLFSFQNASYVSYPITIKYSGGIAAPEVQQGQPFDQKADIFIIGGIIKYLLGKQKPSHNLSDFMKQVEQRVNLNQLNQHNWFKDESITKQAIEQMHILQD